MATVKLTIDPDFNGNVYWVKIIFDNGSVKVEHFDNLEDAEKFYDNVVPEMFEERTIKEKTIPE